jgi:hypothetical protein
LTIAAVIVAIVKRPLTCQGNCAAALAAALPSSARKLQEKEIVRRKSWPDGNPAIA